MIKKFRNNKISKDEDLLKIVNFLKGGKITSDSQSFEDWLIALDKDKVLLDGEKERMRNLV